MTLDNDEANLFVGAESGVIYCHQILAPPRNMQMGNDDSKVEKFVGHKKSVTFLSVSMDGQMLASGSDDFSVRLWSILGRECVRTLDHKGKITMTRFMTPMNGMLNPDLFEQRIYLAQLKKSQKDSNEDVVLEFHVLVRPTAGGGVSADCRVVRPAVRRETRGGAQVAARVASARS